MGNRTHGWDYWVAPTLPLKVRKAFKGEKGKRWKREKVKRWKGEKMDTPINLSTCTLIENVLAYNIPINWEEFVISVMPTQDKHSSHIQSAGQINSLAYKLVKTQQLPNSPTHKLTNSSTHQLTNSSTHQLINSPTHQLTNSPTHQLTNSPTHQLINSSTHQLINSPTHQLTNSSTHQPINSSTHQPKKLKNLKT